MVDAISGVLALAGAAFVLLAGVGVARFPDLYSRMHAAAKASTLGIVLVALSAMVAVGDGRPKLVLAILLIFITTPAASHLVGRVAYRAHGVDVRVDAEDQLAASPDLPDRGE